MNDVLRLRRVCRVPEANLSTFRLFVVAAALGLAAPAISAEDPPVEKPAEKPAAPVEKPAEKPAERTTAPQPSLDELFGNRVPQETP